MVALNRSAVTVISSRPELSSEAAVVAAWAQWVPQISNAKLAIARGVVTRRMNAAFIPNPLLLCCALWGARTVPGPHVHTNSLQPHRPLLDAMGARDLFLPMAPMVRTTLRYLNISLLDQAGDSPKRPSARLMRQMRASSFGVRTATGRGRPSAVGRRAKQAAHLLLTSPQ